MALFVTERGSFGWVCMENERLPAIVERVGRWVRHGGVKVIDSLVLNVGSDASQEPATVGGKAAQLGRLARIDGVRVPFWFCVTTDAYRQMLTAEVSELVEHLAQCDPGDPDAVIGAAQAVRAAILAAGVPADVAAAIQTELAEIDPSVAYAVRSSATAEDLPNASFAGQHDTYLNVIGAESVIESVARCWASLFTDRAVSYRQINGIDHRRVAMAVVVQRMVVADVSGVMFTADPASGHRRITVIESTFGLGEDLVSGASASDSFRVRDGEIVGRMIGHKSSVVVGARDGGTKRQPVEPGLGDSPSLTDDQLIRLEILGRQIEAQFGCPQDIEWARAGDDVSVLQSRPITTLYPVPASDDGTTHVYLSVGHQQMMTDPMRPLGLSMWKLTAQPPMHEAGGRLFVDVAAALSSPARAGLLSTISTGDPLTGDALSAVIERADIIPPPADMASPPGAVAAQPAVPPSGPPPLELDESIVDELISANRQSVDRLREQIHGRTGSDLFEFILSDITEMKRILFDPRSYQVFMTAMDATHWLNDHLERWLGMRSAADPLAMSVPNNVTSEMGLALMDVADVVRQHPGVVRALGEAGPDMLDQLDLVDGGTVAREAIETFLATYGMRCVGEIDITRPRWAEDPSALAPTILSNVKQFPPGEGRRRFDEGYLNAMATAEEYVRLAEALPDGASKAQQLREKIAVVRAFIGYREYPKYGLVSRYLIYKQALMGEAQRLTQAGVFSEPEDCFYLSLQEFHDVARTGMVDGEAIAERKEAFDSYRTLSPPRVITSDGEVFTGRYHREGLPEGALIGLPVSAGVVEGRARVVADISEVDLETGDILVTAFTDPSWTPVFVRIAGLVTEVGGLMTHGAVIAREYGLPAVVGVERATAMIRDGQRLRIDGTTGVVEVLTD